MPESYRQRHLKVLAGANKDLKTLYQNLVRDINELVQRYTEDDVVPKDKLSKIRKEVSGLVNRMFLAPDPDTGAMVPFDIVMGRVVPLSPYMRVLWKAVVDSTTISVEQHANIMRQRLQNRPDLLGRLENATVNPMALARTLRENVDINPIGDYDPFHMFVYGDSPYTLSPRIWDNATKTMRKVDAYLTEAISTGKSSLTISKELEQFLNPDRKGLTTKKPYGTKASYDGMRLARTEITAAAHRASFASAQLNPFVSGYERRLSNRRRGPCDICKAIAAGGPYPKDDSTHLPPSHPNCMCYIIWVYSQMETAIADIEGNVQGTDVAFTRLVTPLRTAFFVRLLLSEITAAELTDAENLLE